MNPKKTPAAQMIERNHRLLVMPGAFLFRDLFRPSALWSARQIMLALWLADDPMTAKEIERATKICSASVYAAVGALNGNLVACKPVPGGQNLYYLSTANADAFRAAWNLQKTFERDDSVEGEAKLTSKIASVIEGPGYSLAEEELADGMLPASA